MTNNDPSIAAAPAAASRDFAGAESSGDPQSTPARTGPRTSLFDGVVQFFRARGNGSSLRDDLADALAEAAPDAASFSPAERAMLNNILRLREVRVEDVMIPRT